ncbi:MAG: glycosyltransferase family 2 protein [Lachnospiraceae bacterium]|nr:glycosyltransferase family 2 protein [Lachnospiraceae bacterium]
MKDKKTVSIIVPCLNEQEVLPLFYDAILPELKKIDAYYEILLVDDGSDDDTISVMQSLAQKDPCVRYYSFSRNFGKEAAMYAGFVNAKGDYIVVMDVDLQDPPDMLPKMFSVLEEGTYDCVATRRVNRKGEPFFRSLFATAFYRIINRISDAQIMDGARDYRMMTRAMADAILSMSEYNRFSKGIFGWVGFRICWLEFENTKRKAGKSKWSFWGLLRYAVDGILNFSQVPLSIASWIGIMMTLFSAVMLVFVVVRRAVFGDPVAGWASLICVIIFIGGLQLFCLGIMGQYMAKMYMETKKRPHFIIARSNDEDVRKIR